MLGDTFSMPMAMHMRPQPTRTAALWRLWQCLLQHQLYWSLCPVRVAVVAQRTLGVSALEYRL